MKILHYSLGTPPYRSGGLTKYSIDLMKAQVELNNDVCLIYPGAMGFSNKCKIKAVADYEGIKVYELKNPLPVPLVQGVKDPKRFYASRDIEIFKKWLEDLKPEIVHVHTFMGLPLEFLKACRLCNIKVVYTTHDYYGICPKVNLVRSNGDMCNSNKDYNQCMECCKNGYSMKLIYILQSNLYKSLKEKGITKPGWNTMKKTYSSISKAAKSSKKENNYFMESEYKKLKSYYEEMFSYIDSFHFNSSVAEGVYKSFMGDIKGEVVNITHNGIKDNRKLKSYNTDEPLNISFLGSNEKHKGLPLLMEALEKLNKENINYHLNIYGVYPEVSKDNVTYHGRYSYDKLGEIFEKTDVAIIPSVWYETYGFVALEPYSYGVPIITTDLVGFNDLIQNKVNGLIVEPKADALKEAIENVIDNREILSEINRNILKADFKVLDMKNHCKSIIDVYHGLE